MGKSGSCLVQGQFILTSAVFSVYHSLSLPLSCLNPWEPLALFIDKRSLLVYPVNRIPFGTYLFIMYVVWKLSGDFIDRCEMWNERERERLWPTKLIIPKTRLASLYWGHCNTMCLMARAFGQKIKISNEKNPIIPNTQFNDHYCVSHIIIVDIEPANWAPRDASHDRHCHLANCAKFQNSISNRIQFHWPICSSDKRQKQIDK